MKHVDALKYEFNPRSLYSFPVKWKDVFGREAPLAVELGCGNGEFIVSWAQKYPDWNFFGIDLSLASCERTQIRIHQNGLSNIRIIRDDARFVLRELFNNNQIHQILMNFPDPWPKEKHKNRRIIVPGFIDTLSTVLANDGIFELVTDQKWYVVETRELFEKHGCFRISEIEENYTRDFPTKYERKWKKLQRLSYRFFVTKIKSKLINRILENEKMPHFIIKKKIHPENVSKLQGEVEKKDGSIFKIKEVFSNLSQRVFLLRTVTTDYDYTQNFFILIAPYGKGFIVKIDTSYQPYRTPAVKFVIEKVAMLLGDSKIS